MGVIALGITASACASSSPPREEASRGPSVPVYFHYAKPTSLVLVEFDADRDRKITTAELGAGIDHEWQLAAGEEADGDLGAIGFQNWVQNAVGTVDTRFTHLTVDTDSDGSISEDEFRAALEQEFEAADNNKDGNVTRTELVTFFERQSRGQNAGGQRAGEGRGQGRGQGRGRGRGEGRRRE